MGQRNDSPDPFKSSKPRNILSGKPMGFLERRGWEKFKKSEGITGKRTKDIRLPSRTELAAREAIGSLGKRAVSGAKQTVNRALSRKK